MDSLVSQECLDCIMEDIRETPLDEGILMHPVVLRRIVEEIIRMRSWESTRDARSAS